MKLWHGILLITLILVLPLTGCDRSSEDTDLQNYLAQIEPLMLEYLDTSSEFENIAEDISSLDLSNYSEKYGDLLNRFKAIEYQTEAMNLRSYIIDMLYSNQQWIDEAVAYLATGDAIHYDMAVVYAQDTDEARRLMIDEAERLSDMVEQRDGVSNIQIISGILGAGIVVGIAVAIRAIAKKIKGN